MFPYKINQQITQFIFQMNITFILPKFYIYLLFKFLSKYYIDEDSELLWI